MKPEESRPLVVRRENAALNLLYKEAVGSLTCVDVMAAVCLVCWFCCLRVSELEEEAADSVRTTQIRSPGTMPQEDSVCPASLRGSAPFRDRLKRESALRPDRESQL